MKVVIPEDISGKELYKFLIENKAALKAQKKALPKKCDPIGGVPAYFDNKQITKTQIGDIPKDATSVKVEFVANAAMWFDSQQDVLLTDSWAKTIKDGNGRLHLKDHTYEMDAEVGDVQNIYSKDISLHELGLNKTGVTQVLVYSSEVQKSYDEKTFNKYKNGKVNQHSIGLQYVNLQLAVNDEDYKDEFALWNKYIDKIINKEDALQYGYMWIVPEIKLIEASAVVAGANKLTPTLYVGGKSVYNGNDNSTQDEPEITTQNEPQQKFDLSEAIKQTKFFN